MQLKETDLQKETKIRVLIASNSSAAIEYRTWLGKSLASVVEICDSTEYLFENLDHNKWDCLVVERSSANWPNDEILGQLRDRFPDIPTVFISRNEDEDTVNIMRMGVSDFLVPPLNYDQLVGSVGKFCPTDVVDMVPIEPIYSAPRDEQLVPVPEDTVFGGSAKMEALKEVLNKVLDANLPVLITGESGTGKELVAQYLFNESSRQGPFVKVNCAAIPSELLESELFGYEKGAFTGAYRRKSGKFEVADGGFLFLDEISELSYPLQSKLLHVLQDGKFSTLGSTGDVSVDVRIIAATNQDLEDCVRNGVFRDDLYFRLNVVHFHVPPLRERLDQLESIVEYFLEKFARQYNTKPVQLSPEARSFLYNYSWPGNIRELENAIRRVTVLGGDNLLGHINVEKMKNFGFPGTEILNPGSRESRGVSENAGLSDGPVAEDSLGAGSEPLAIGRIDLEKGVDLKKIAKKAALAAEKEAISRVLQQTRWNRKKTAEILQVSYKTLLTKIKETGLDEN
jgi:DNA-binding NtrC family response regulator